MEIKFDNVSYIENNKTGLKRKILNDLTFTIKDNTVAGFIGPAGSGKTTILELINALLFPSSGVITIGENETGKKENLNEIRFNVGLVYQDPERQFFCETVKEELAFALQNFNFQVENKEKRISDSLKMVGLDDTYLNRSPFELSKGEQRKVALAVVLAFNPEVIILDEPMMDLDSASKKHLLKLIKMMKLRYNKTIILVTNDTDLLHAVADNIYVINDGRIVLEGSKYEVFGDYERLNNFKIKCPKIMEFSHLVKNKKNIDIGYRDDINDLMKDIYRYVK